MSEAGAAWLGPDEPAPVEAHGPLDAGHLLLVCEHAGNRVPRRLQALAPPPGELARHIAWDIGAAGLARSLAEALAAPLVLQRYSRLVIDGNRPHHAPSLMPAHADGTEIPFNQAVTEADRTARWHAIHQPFHRRVAALLDARPRPVIAVHSFTPSLGGVARPWQVGLLARHERGLAAVLAETLTAARPDLVWAFNQPYWIDDDTDYTIPVHGERRRLPHLLLEVRNDLIATPAGQNAVAAWLAPAIAAALARGQ